MNEIASQPDPSDGPQPPSRASTALPVEEGRALAVALGDVKQRASVQARRIGLVLGIAASLLLLLLGAGLLALRIEWARTLAWTGALAALAAFTVQGIRIGRRRAADDEHAALLLGTVSPEDASDLLSAVQLSRDVEQGRELSRALVAAHLGRMAARAQRLDAAKALSPKPLQRALAALAAVTVLLLATWLFGGARWQEAWRFLAFRTSAEASALFAPEPIAGDFQLTFRYPAHTGLPSRTIHGFAGTITVPLGTVVELTARADRDVEKAFAVVVGEQVPLTVKGRELSGNLLIKSAGEWRLRYAKSSGRIVAEGPPRPIVVEPDRFPEVKLEKPTSEVTVEGKEALTLEYSASDDYGISQLELVYSVGSGAPEQRKALPMPAEATRRHRGDHHWDLAPLDLKPGDRVTYRIEATDNDGVSNPKKGASATQVLKVFSETEHHREVLKRVEELWERLVTGLADRLEEPTPGAQGEKADDEWSRRTKAKDEALSTLGEGMRKLARELLGDKHAPAEVSRALLHVGDRLGPVVQRTAAARQSLTSAKNAQNARLLAGALAAEIAEEEKGVLYLEDLIDRRKLLDLAELARELQQGRKELAQLVERFKKAPNEEARREILQQVARLKERLAEIHKRMRELQKGIVDEHLNEEADRLMQGGDDMMSELDEIQQQLAKGDTDKALESLEKLQKQLEEMEQKLRDQAGEVDDDTRELTEKMQRLASDLVDIEAEQKSLQQKTEQLRQRERDERAERLRKLGKQFLDKQKERAKVAKQEFDAIDPSDAEPLGLDDELRSAEDHIDQLQKALESGDFDEALEQAKRASSQSRNMQRRLDLERDTSRQFPGLNRDPRAIQQSGEHVGKAQRPLREVAEDLEKLMRAAKAAPTEAERRQMQELSQKQSSLQKRTGALQQQLDEIGRKMPVFGPEQGKLVQEAASQMGGAKEKLSQGEARDASGRQGEALRKLQAFREAMREQQKSQQGTGGVPMPFGPSQQPGCTEGDGPSEQQEKVEIPGGDQNRTPAEFRDELMKAMKDETPEQYRERVRNYYEELIR